ncbi:UNVERIFIED_CONTAM: hypothetical protein GTU68_066772 [Idotea baltica]|nr:hypothetical protein [Idotea baltica]
MKFGVVVFPGSNCDRDTIHVLQNVMQQEVEVLWHKETELNGFTNDDCIVLPGGFSYGDYLRSGAIARFSPIMKAVIEFANNGGKVLGICNGFQILCESGLLPGALLHNDTEKFICKNIHLKAKHNNSDITKNIELEQALKIPIAHAEGRFYAPQETIDKMLNNKQILFEYSNPNGSVLNIAGICNKQRNVFGMMPHPERASEVDLGNVDGRILFESMLSAV